ncbi:hypothetical protein [Brevibacillus choshinensis]|uniref:Uncharacterized protein n=1 Tax=Brevibacillus choshinensis TaxID=54911 RepID=A0ABX7FND0_BRECH|nr:hypothetical protein [Brevibacillus choshinensis]QRG67652.1 hypothetical protein JNE38_30255 [Brevibacillus choshinensis]
MKKPKKPGDNISMKTKKNESPLVLDWINSQTNLMDSIRYLIENEVAANGIRNLQKYIPAERAVSIGGAAAMWHEIGMVDTRAGQSANYVPAESRAHEEAAASKEREQHPAEDDIDDDDIESWT